jgi:hypothetical protein
MWVIKIILVSIRNQLFLRLAAWPATRMVKQYIKTLGFNPMSVALWFGLLGPEELSVLIIFNTDKELAAFLNANRTEDVIATFRKHLSKGLYPKHTVSQVRINFFSHEEIKRIGGYYLYFK